MDISEWDQIIIAYRSLHMVIQVQDLSHRRYFPELLFCTYKRTYTVVRICTAFLRMYYPNTYGVDSYTEDLMRTQKDKISPFQLLSQSALF